MRRSTIRAILPGLLIAVSAGRAATNYVSLLSTNPVPPYSSWETAATNIQDAVNAAAFHNVILVGPGVYNSGFVSIWNGYQYVRYRVGAAKPVFIVAANGPAATIIDGSSNTPCVYLSGAVLEGFTLTNSTRGAYVINESLLTNCVITGMLGLDGRAAMVARSAIRGCLIVNNRTPAGLLFGYAALYLSSGLVEQCIVSNDNSIGIEASGTASLVRDCIVANNGGVGIDCRYGAHIDHCTITGNRNGGVICYLNATLERSIISRNIAYREGGGVWCYYNCTVRNCLIRDNTAYPSASYLGGGGVYANGGLIQNCTIVTNWAIGRGGGVFTESGATLENCIVWGNRGASNYWERSAGTNRFNCIEGWTTGGQSVIAQNPLFLSPGDLHLASGSPCIDAGTNTHAAAGAVDLDGVWRIMGPRIDLGCYETTGMPFIAAAPVVNGVKGKTLSIGIVASGLPQWYAAADLPPGLGVDTATGIISGSPSQRGFFDATVLAGNTFGTGTGMLSFSICDQDVRGGCKASESIVTRTKAVHEGGDREAVQRAAASARKNTYYEAVQKYRSRIVARADLGAPVDLSLLLDRDALSFAAGDMALSLPVSNATARTARSLVYKIMGTNEKGRQAKRAVISLKCSKRRVSFTVKGFDEQFVAVANRYARETNPAIAADLPVSVWAGTSLRLSAATIVAGSSQYDAPRRGGNDTGPVPTVKLRTRKLPRGESLVLTSPASVRGHVGEAFFHQITATGSPTNFSATGLPSGLEVNPTNGMIEGTPLDDGTFTATLTARSPEGHGTGTLTLYIFAAGTYTGALAAVAFDESLDSDLKRVNIDGDTELTVVHSGRSLFSAQVTWPAPLDFTTLADVSMMFEAGDAWLADSFSSAALSPDKAVFTYVSEDEGAPGTAATLELRRKGDLLLIDYAAYSPDYLMVAARYTEATQDEAINVTEQVHFSIGDLLQCMHAMHVTGEVRTTHKPNPGGDPPEYLLPRVNVKGE